MTETETVENEVTQPVPTQGKFVESLKRNNRQIKSDRADSIAEDAQTIFRREVEDLRISIRRMERERDNMLDLSPETATSLKLAKDFNATEYVKKELEIGLNIRNAQIKLDIAERRYSYLFGGKI